MLLNYVLEHQYSQKKLECRGIKKIIVYIKNVEQSHKRLHLPFGKKGEQMLAHTLS